MGNIWYISPNATSGTKEYAEAVNNKENKENISVTTIFIKGSIATRR